MVVRSTKVKIKSKLLFFKIQCKHFQNFNYPFQNKNKRFFQKLLKTIMIYLTSFCLHIYYFETLKLIFIK